MKNSVNILALLLLGTFLTGCSIYSIDSRDTTQDFYTPKKSIDEIQYLEKVEQPSIQIGVVIVTTERRQSLEDVLPKLKQEAAILGGDIITDIQSNATGAWKSIKFQKLLGNAYVRCEVSAKVLVLK